MKKAYILFSVLLSTAFMTNAQNTVVADASAEYLGYANVYETIANGGGYVFDSAWGVADLKSVVDAGAGTVTLQPNFNTYNAEDAFWVDPATGLGNKQFEANTFVENDTNLIGSELTFTGGVASYTLDPSYVAIAFIKVFNADFSVLKLETAPLVAGQDFSITYTNVEPEDTTIQYGYQIVGLNANPANEDALGSIVIVDTVLGTNDFDATSISTYPNPVTSTFIIESQEVITSVAIFNVLGQQVINETPDALNYVADFSSLTAGVYLANIATQSGSKTVKVIKK
ncbi:T9SS type A sorting domain-containing protein [Flavobacteriaceae bacterium]|nr:T9SS type A sorting domain-containing protein [Flavobacteriaceae bacterium]